MRWSRMYFGRPWRKATGFVLTLLALAIPSWCQSGDQGSIAGIVFDASGAVVADVLLKARNLSTSFVLTTNTNEYGLFRFAVLPVGLYELSGEHAGFATVNVRNIDLTVGTNITFTIRFIVAGAKEGMTVTEEAPV